MVTLSKYLATLAKFLATLTSSWGVKTLIQCIFPLFIKDHPLQYLAKTYVNPAQISGNPEQFSGNPDIILGVETPIPMSYPPFYQ